MLDYSALFKKLNYEEINYMYRVVDRGNISIPDLIKMKQKTGRQQDKMDIKYLEALKDEKK